MLAMFIGGHFIGQISAARSRDAFGHKRWAILTFIPIAVFWLLLTKSHDENSTKKFSFVRIFSGGLGVVFGFVMIFAVKLVDAYAAEQITQRLESAKEAGLFDGISLERDLANAVKQVVVPLAVDKVTTLVKIMAEGKPFTYVYEVDPPLEAVSFDVRVGIAKAACGQTSTLLPAINAGATFRYTYLRKDQTEIGSVDVTKQTCGH